MLLKPSRYEELNEEAVDLLETYGVSTFPLDVMHLAEKMGIRMMSYSSIPHTKQSAFSDISRDAFTLSMGKYEVDTTCIFFNQNSNEGRLRHSIAHEIAHIWLEHPNSNEPFETEAEYLAAYLLAPIPIIIKEHLMTVHEVQDYFNISREAARIALRRASNRRSCRKPGFDYEYRIIDMFLREGGDRLESA